MRHRFAVAVLCALLGASLLAQNPVSIQQVGPSTAVTTTIPVSGTVAVTESGTWTVQPGNTANSTAWLVTGTGGTFPSTQSGTWTVLPGNTANTTAWLVTGTGGTFPATQSGTWNITNVSGTISLPTGASTSAKQPALGTAGTASTDVISVQGIASMTPLLVTPAANSAVNVAQINGVTTLMGNGTTGTGSQRVTIASDNTAFQVNANVNQVGGVTTVISPCETAVPTVVPISQTASTKVISATSSKKNYICAIVVVAGAAEIVNVVEGTGTVCATSTAAIVGSTTAGNGMSFAANGGFSAVGGKGVAIPGIGSNVDTCLTQSGSNRVAGFLSYVQQ